MFFVNRKHAEINGLFVYLNVFVLLAEVVFPADIYHYIISDLYNISQGDVEYN